MNENNDDHILAKISKYIEDKANILKWTEISNRKSDFLVEDLRSSMKFHRLQDKFALMFDEWIGFAIGFGSAASTTYLVRRSFKARAYKMALFAGVGLPVLLGATSGTFSRLNVNSLLRLEYNCRECYQLQTLLSVNLFASINSFLLSNMIIWVGDTQIKNYSIFKKHRNESYFVFIKNLFNDFKKRTFKAKMYRKYGVLLAFTSIITYLFALEQQREFTILFTKYYQNIQYEEHIKKQGIDLNKDAKI